MEAEALLLRASEERFRSMVLAATMLAMLLETIGHEVITENNGVQVKSTEATAAACILNIGLSDLNFNDLPLLKSFCLL